MKSSSMRALLILSTFAFLSAGADDMGPIGFSWPTPRAWSSTEDNTSPCGSADGPSDRTKFPLTNGAVALVINEESYKINLAISYSTDPTVNSDFEDLVSYSNFPVLKPGNECYSVPDPSSGVTSGQKATLQLSYSSVSSDGGSNQTYYTCADITYIELSAFTETISCYNYSSSTGVTSSAAGVAPTPAATSGSSTSSGASSTTRLSGGAIAGIVVGVVVVLVAVVGVFVLRMWRRRERVWRNSLSKVRMDELKRTSNGSRTAAAAQP